MEVTKIIMNNGNIYHVIWDKHRIDGDQIEIIDIQKGWVNINLKQISEKYILDKDFRLSTKIKNMIKENYDY